MLHEPSRNMRPQSRQLGSRSNCRGEPRQRTLRCRPLTNRVPTPFALRCLLHQRARTGAISRLGINTHEADSLAAENSPRFTWAQTEGEGSPRCNAAGGPTGEPSGSEGVQHTELPMCLSAQRNCFVLRPAYQASPFDNNFCPIYVHAMMGASGTHHSESR